MRSCDAKIRPFGDSIELLCDKDEVGHDEHSSTLHDFAYAGSRTIVVWYETDRRNFRGPWTPCLRLRGCVYPAQHPGNCAQ